jgi:surface protein
MSSSKSFTYMFQPQTKNALKQAIKDYQNGFNKERGEPNDWDVSLITDMSGLFKSNKTFNEPIFKWDTSNVTNMKEMFYDALAFNQPINDNRSNCLAFLFTQYRVVQDLTNITGRRLIRKLPTFLIRRIALYAFGDHIGRFDTGQVTDMSYMFYGAASFNQPIGQWNTMLVTNMNSMFAFARYFNQPIRLWNVQQVTDMNQMFKCASSFNQPIGQWKTNQVQHMSNMFKGATKFNQSIVQWNTDQVINMEGMFHGVYSMTHPKPKKLHR